MSPHSNSADNRIDCREQKRRYHNDHNNPYYQFFPLAQNTTRSFTDLY